VASYTSYRLGQSLAVTLPLSWSYRIARGLADLQHVRHSADRAAVEHNVAALVHDPAEIARIAREIFRNFATYLVDFLRLPCVDDAFVAQAVHVEGLEHLQRVRAQHGGAIAVTAHVGNWELAGAVTAQLGLPVAAIALNHHQPRVTAFFNRQRHARGVAAIPPGWALRHCQRLLAQGHVVAILGDRNYTSRGVLCEFLGRPVVIPRGPALLSLQTGVPIVPGFLVRDTPQTFRLVFEPPIPPTTTGARERDVQQLSQQFVSVIERYIRQFPSQWFLFRPFDVPETAATCRAL